jgi:hypothetical protein
MAPSSTPTVQSQQLLQELDEVLGNLRSKCRNWKYGIRQSFRPSVRRHNTERLL